MAFDLDAELPASEIEAKLVEDDSVWLFAVRESIDDDGGGETLPRSYDHIEHEN